MKRTLSLLIGFALLVVFALAGSAAAQVATAEIQGVDPTAPHSSTASAVVRDDSVGEVTVVVRALDANGAPVAGASVAWNVNNTTSNLVYVVGRSGTMERMLLLVHQTGDLQLDGGVTDADGTAYLVLDSATAGDARLSVTVGGVEGAAYTGGGLRVVWF